MIKEIVEKIHDSAFCSKCNQDKILCLMSLGKEPLSELTLRQLKELLSDSDFSSQIYHLFLGEVKFGIEALSNEIEHSKKIGRNPKFDEIRLDRELQKLEVADFNGLLKLYDDELKVSHEGVSNCAREHYGDGVEAYIAQYYVVYKVIRLFYEEYRRSRYIWDDINLDLSERLVKLYSGVDVNLPATDKQFDKYGLLTFNEVMWFDYDHLARGVVDERLGKFFSIPISESLAGAIHQLLSQDKIGSLAFRVKSITDGRPSMEEKAYGSVLSLELSELPSVSEFYSVEKFGDKLTVVHDPKARSLIFEELNDEFKLVGDSVITQLVHLEYKETDEGCVITHIDHEQIIYSLDQYDKRTSQSDVSVRGRKIKSFKVDYASIPVDFRFKGDLFLAIVLDGYFVNKQLIAEYFERVSASNRGV